MLKGMGNRVRDQPQRRDHHNLEREGRVVGWRRDKLWDECGKFQNHGGVEALVRCRGVCAPQQPTYGPLGEAGPIARPDRDGDAAG